MGFGRGGARRTFGHDEGQTTPAERWACGAAGYSTPCLVRYPNRSWVSAIYAAAGAPGAVELIVSPDLAHEIDMPLITAWLRRQSNPAAAGASRL